MKSHHHPPPIHAVFPHLATATNTTTTTTTTLFSQLSTFPFLKTATATPLGTENLGCISFRLHKDKLFGCYRSRIRGGSERALVDPQPSCAASRTHVQRHMYGEVLRCVG